MKLNIQRKKGLYGIDFNQLRPGTFWIPGHFFEIVFIKPR